MKSPSSTRATTRPRRTTRCRRPATPYNEALAIYHQYSTMDATRLASEQAKADAAQKAAQANYDSLQEQYTTASQR